MHDISEAVNLLKAQPCVEGFKLCDLNRAVKKNPLHDKKLICQCAAQLILRPFPFTLQLRTPRITVLYQQGEG